MNIKNIKNAQEIKIQKGHCVYFLTNKNGDILYVGRSDKSSLSRINEHLSSGKEFERLFVIENKSKEESELLESKLIVKIKPKYNRKIEKRQLIGLLNADDVKKQTGGVSKYFIKSAAREYGIKTEVINSTSYWAPDIIQAVKKYVEKNKNKYLRLMKFR